MLAGLLDLGAMSRSPKDGQLAGGIEYFISAQDRGAVVTNLDLSMTNGLTTNE